MQWRHLAINVDPNLGGKNSENSQDLSEDPWSDLSPFLTSIISLKLYKTDYCSFEISSEVPQILSAILPMMLNIQKIWINVGIFQNINPSWFAKASAPLMSKVKEFHLDCDLETTVPDEGVRCAIGLPLTSVHLQVLHIDTFVFDGADGSVTDRLDKLFRILRQNQYHLRSLQVKDPQLWSNVSSYGFGSLPKFPQLKVLKLTVGSEANEAELVQFLNNQPVSLEEIDLEFFGSIPSAVFQVVKDRALNSNLKVLRILAAESNPMPSDIQRWNFLQETDLEEFSFKLLEKASVQLKNEELEDFFGSLPKKAKKLSITRVMPGDWPQIFNLNVSQCFDPEVLTHLRLRSCRRLLKNSVLQEFWKTLKNLRLLDLSDCGNTCTDTGFTGVPTGLYATTQGVSISLLRGLKSLTLQNCFGLTNRTLIDGIKFPELQFLDLTGNFQLTDSGYEAVIRQNPSLRTFASEAPGDGTRQLPYPNSERRRRSVKINARLTREFYQDVHDATLEGIGYQIGPPPGEGGGDGGEVE